MLITKGQVVNNIDILKEKWGSESVYNENQLYEPSIGVYKNTSEALSMLEYHIKANSNMIMHTDVDVDGFGSTYIIKKFCEFRGARNILTMINKEKEHGIKQKHAEYINNRQDVDLLIITDSSSNQIDIIKQFNCDVLIIDHHEIEHNESLHGFCNDGIHKYVVVNNTIENDTIQKDIDWLGNEHLDKVDISGIADRNMSCAVLIYELLRLYCLKEATTDTLVNSRLIQWAGITLFTDVIDTLNSRNQWYISNTLWQTDIEPTLLIIMNELNRYKTSLDKSYIQYTFAPIINKTIRAGQGALALHCVMNSPHEIAQLKQYSDLQAKVIDLAIHIQEVDELSKDTVKTLRKFEGNLIMLDTSDMDIHANYNGVIAGHLAGDNHQSAVVYKVYDGGICKGSFRGCSKSIDYREIFLKYDNGIKAMGHTAAFGFEATKEQLKAIMKQIKQLDDSVVNTKAYLTAGNMSPEEYGEFHVNDLTQFKRTGAFYNIAVGNSKVITLDEIMIRVKASDIELVSTKPTSKGNLYSYKALGINCKAFQPIQSAYCDIYLEFTNQVEAYIREV